MEVKSTLFTKTEGISEGAYPLKLYIFNNLFLCG